MIMSATYLYVRCDECEELLKDPKTENDLFGDMKELTKVLSLAGWHSFGDKVHICKDCYLKNHKKMNIESNINRYE
jgi:hypothetical protein